MRNGSNFIFFHIASHLYFQHLLSFITNLRNLLYSILNFHVQSGLCLNFLFCSTGSLVMRRCRGIFNCSYFILYKLVPYIPPLFFFFKDIFMAIIVYLSFQMKLVVNCYMPEKKIDEILYWDCVKFIYYLHDTWYAKTWYISFFFHAYFWDLNECFVVFLI